MASARGLAHLKKLIAAQHGIAETCSRATGARTFRGQLESMVDRTRRNLLIGGSVVGAVGLAAVLPAKCAMQQRRRKPDVTENSPPERPRGQPKPLLEEDIAPVLARLDAWYAAHLRAEQYVFNPPATDAQLDAFERLIGLKLPQSYRQLYRWHDGDEEAPLARWGHIYGLSLLPLEGATAKWEMWSKALTGYFKGNRYKIPGAGWPVGAVDPAYINPRWIPLTWAGTGDHIGLDLDPRRRGRIGQIILFGRDEAVKVVLAESLGKFLEWIADLLESGNVRFDTYEGVQQFYLKTPRCNGFHDGARILLGAPDPFLGLEDQFTYTLAARAARGELSMDPTP